MTFPAAGPPSPEPAFGATGVPRPAVPTPRSPAEDRGRRAHARSRKPAKAPKPSRVEHLAVVPDIDGPRVRLGMAWAFVVFTAAAAGPIWIGGWMAAAGGIAAVQSSRSWRSRSRRPHEVVTVAGAAALPLAAGISAIATGVALALFAAAAVGAVFLRAAAGRSTRGRLSASLTFTLGASIGLAAAAPVLARQLGLVEAVVLLAFVGVFDASNYLIGSGASNPWEGPAAGMAFIAAVTLAVAAVFVPPFRGASPWLLGLLALVLTPAGPVLASSLLGSPNARVPALRRLDSLLLTGPIWVAVATFTVS